MPVCCEVNLKPKTNIAAVRRTDFLFTAGVTAMVAGLLFSFSPHVFDIFVLLSFSVTGVILMVAFWANQAGDAMSFPLVVLLGSMLRMGLSVASARLILAKGQGGDIVNCVGGFIVGDSLGMAIVLFATAAVGMFALICKVMTSVIKVSGEFTRQSEAIQRTGLRSEFNSGVLSLAEAARLEQKLEQQAGFFSAMGGVGRFMMAEAGVGLLIIGANVILGLGIAAVGYSAAGSAAAYGQLAIGAGTLTMFPAVLSMLACRHFVKKSFYPPLGDEDLQRRQSERIKVVAREVETQRKEQQTSQAEALPQNRQELPASGLDSQNPAKQTEASPTRQAVDTEWLEENTEESREKLWQWAQMCRGRTSEDQWYDSVANLIGKEDASMSTVAVVGQAVEGLPVTLPVNVAVRLAKKGLRCLLVDVDVNRSGISRVFDLEEDEKAIRPVQTCVKNLSVLNASKLAGGSDKLKRGIKKVLARSASKYDRVILYVPDLKAADVEEEISGADCSVLLFGHGGTRKANSRFAEKILAGNCQVIEPME